MRIALTVILFARGFAQLVGFVVAWRIVTRRGQVRPLDIHAIALYEFELRWNEEMLKRIKHLPPLSGGPSLRRSNQK